MVEFIYTNEPSYFDNISVIITYRKEDGYPTEPDGREKREKFYLDDFVRILSSRLQWDRSVEGIIDQVKVTLKSNEQGNIESLANTLDRYYAELFKFKHSSYRQYGQLPAYNVGTDPYIRDPYVHPYMAYDDKYIHNPYTYPTTPDKCYKKDTIRDEDIYYLLTS